MSVRITEIEFQLAALDLKAVYYQAGIRCEEIRWSDYGQIISQHSHYTWYNIIKYILLSIMVSAG